MRTELDTVGEKKKRSDPVVVRGKVLYDVGDRDWHCAVKAVDTMATRSWGT